METLIRDYMPADAAAVNTVAAAAFVELKGHYKEWSKFSDELTRTSGLSEKGDMIVATIEGRVVGVVTYVGPGRSRDSHYPAEWPILRMLVVDPAARGRGVGRALVEECVRRARCDGASLIALHTTPFMRAAVRLYENMGFTLEREGPTIYGIPFGIYVKKIG